MDLLKSLPIGLYLEQPVTWLHRIDPRVKLGWLVSVLLAPVLANAAWRIGLVLFLIGLTLSARIPLRVWRQQMGFLLALATLVTVLLMVMPDGIAVVQHPRLPSPELLAPVGTESQSIPLPAKDYQYVLLDWRFITVTQQSVQLAIRVGTLLFT